MSLALIQSKIKILRLELQAYDRDIMEVQSLVDDLQDSLKKEQMVRKIVGVKKRRDEVKKNVEDVELELIFWGCLTV